MQHAKVLQLEKKGATDQEQLLAEKIAEKQLKIKQVIKRNNSDINTFSDRLFHRQD